jgi:hypothetical protein
MSAPLSKAVFGGVLALGLWSVIGCGGGSPSDVVLPDAVDVSLLPEGAIAAPSVTLELSAASGRDIGIAVQAVGLAGATGVAFELDYDPAVLEFVGIGPGTFFGQGGVVGAENVEGAPGKLVGVAGSVDQSPFQGTGLLLTLQFRLRQLRDGETTLIFGVPQSLVYGTDGAAGAQSFTGARLLMRIRAPN